MSDLLTYCDADSFEAVATRPGYWFLLHTKSRQEKALSETLGAKGIAHYLPLVTVARTHGSRKVKVDLPLFPGYLFLKGSLEEAYASDQTKRVSHILRVDDQEKISWELRNIAIALGRSAAPFDPYPHLKTGVKVEVRSGPLRGIQGLIESRTKRDRLILQIDVLGQATSLEIDGALLEVIE